MLIYLTFDAIFLSSFFNIKSGDYYLDHLPAVYMRDAIISGEESSWNATFRDMDKYVVEKTVYAVKLGVGNGQGGQACCNP